VDISGGGAFCNGHCIHVSSTDQVERSLLVTGFGYEHDEAWAANIALFKEFTDVSRVCLSNHYAMLLLSHWTGI
jgi:myo-inositol-1(or 4)-monophosphatase